MLASHAQWQLLAWRQEVVLVPADPAHPMTRPGQMVRARVSPDPPAWYATILRRRPEDHSVRAYVASALAGLCATGYIRPAQNARQRSMDIEVLDTLYEHCDPRHWGYFDWDGALQLAENGYASRYRTLRRARERGSRGRQPA